MLEWLISIEVISSANRSRKHDSVSQNGKKKQRLDDLTHFRVSHRTRFLLVRPWNSITQSRKESERPYRNRRKWRWQLWPPWISSASIEAGRTGVYIISHGWSFIHSQFFDLVQSCIFKHDTYTCISRVSWTTTQLAANQPWTVMVMESSKAPPDGRSSPCRGSWWRSHTASSSTGCPCCSRISWPWHHGVCIRWMGRRHPHGCLGPCRRRSPSCSSCRRRLRSSHLKHLDRSQYRIKNKLYHTLSHKNVLVEVVIENHNIYLILYILNKCRYMGTRKVPSTGHLIGVLHFFI